MRRGEVLGLVGASGAGKSVLLRSIIGLLPPVAGTVRLFGYDLYAAGDEQLAPIKRRWGVLFQANALFWTLSVLVVTHDLDTLYSTRRSSSDGGSHRVDRRRADLRLAWAADPVGHAHYR